MGSGMKGFILDLRTIPAGLLDQAIAISDAFVDKGEILSTRARHSDERPTKPQIWPCSSTSTYSRPRRLTTLRACSTVNQAGSRTTRLQTRSATAIDSAPAESPRDAMSRRGNFEAVFGFEAKLAARAVLLRGGSAGVREKFAPWREPLVYLIDRAEVARKEARERAVLERVECDRLNAAGVTGAAAEARAAAAANALIVQANAIRFAEAHRRDAGIVGSSADLPPDVRQLLEAAGGRQLTTS